MEGKKEGGRTILRLTAWPPQLLQADTVNLSLKVFIQTMDISPGIGGAVQRSNPTIGSETINQGARAKSIRSSTPHQVKIWGNATLSYLIKTRLGTKGMQYFMLSLFSYTLSSSNRPLTVPS